MRVYCFIFALFFVAVNVISSTTTIVYSEYVNQECTGDTYLMEADNPVGACHEFIGYFTDELVQLYNSLEVDCAANTITIFTDENCQENPSTRSLAANVCFAHNWVLSINNIRCETPVK